MSKSESARAEFEIRSRFAQTLSVMSICHYILGIGTLRFLSKEREGTLSGRSA
jgi:hypothetical protein